MTPEPEMVDPLTVRVLSEQDRAGFWLGLALTVVGGLSGLVIGWALTGPVGVMAIRYVLL